MTRNGKIARLPLAIRQQLNQRLQNGELGQELVSWLNQLPEVQARKNRSASVKSWASMREYAPKATTESPPPPNPAPIEPS